MTLFKYATLLTCFYSCHINLGYIYTWENVHLPNTRGIMQYGSQINKRLSAILIRGPHDKLSECVVLGRNAKGTKLDCEERLSKLFVPLENGSKE